MNELQNAIQRRTFAINEEEKPRFAFLRHAQPTAINARLYGHELDQHLRKPFSFNELQSARSKKKLSNQ